MTAELTSSQKSFIKMMTQAEEFEQRGFELILKRNNFEIYFNELATTGFFDPARNPGPVPAENPGSFRVPYWYAIDYLKAVARLSGEKGDAGLAQKVLAIVRNVSQARAGDGGVQDNHYTAAAFVETLGLVPTSTVTMGDIDLIPGWLGGRFDGSIIGSTFVETTLPAFLRSTAADDWQKACRIMYHCTGLSRRVEGDRKKPKTLIDDYWLKVLITRNATTLGAKAGATAAVVFLERLTEVYGLDDFIERQSWLSRPAIEEHEQNHSWDGPANRFVEGLRDVLLGWIDHDAATATPFVENLLDHPAQIARRIAIYVLDQRFAVLRNSIPRLLTSALFENGHLHELYGFLRSHFGELDGEEQTGTLAAIRELPLREGVEESKRERDRHRLQLRWLSAMADQGYGPVDAWIAVLRRDQNVGLAPHPEFHTYVTSRWGFGPTPYTVEELLGLAKSDEIVPRLNAFTETDVWEGPSTRSLTDTLVETVAQSPRTFLDLLPAFEGAKNEYQYAVIQGFKKLWDATEAKPPEGNEAAIDWDDAWPKLIAFFERVTDSEAFWTAPVEEGKRTLSPNRNWLVATMAELLRAGVRTDDKAYRPDLLPRGWALIKVLLEKCEPDTDGDAYVSDALNRAINTLKGKAVEAMLDHALRACRLADQANGNAETRDHTAAWLKLRPTFDAELAKCTDANFEFSALIGAHAPQILYLSEEWFEANFLKMFPLNFARNCLAALDGLAFAPASAPVYKSLVDKGVLDWALRQNLKERHAQENLLQRMALAYFWDQEALDQPRFSYLFEAGQIDALLVLSRYFWSVQGENLSGLQIEKVLAFWARCVAWSATLEKPPATLLSNLALLSCYLKSVGDRELPLLLAVAPYVSVDYNMDRFVEELERLADASPVQISKVLGRMLGASTPVFDYEDKLKRLLTKLARHRDTMAEAIQYAERLVGKLPGMTQLFEQMKAALGKGEGAA